MATLPTNYVDDQLAESMGGRRHYNMTTDAYGTYLTDVTEYTQRGSTFAAAQINETNAQVNTNTTDIADKLSKTGNTQNNTTTFTSDDTSTSPSSFTSISLVSSGETHSSLFRKMSQAIKNIRWLNNNKRTTGAYDTYRDTVAFTSGDSSDSSATSWTSVSTLTSGLTHATLLNRISAMMKNTRFLYNSVQNPTRITSWSNVFSTKGSNVSINNFVFYKTWQGKFLYVAASYDAQVVSNLGVSIFENMLSAYRPSFFNVPMACYFPLIQLVRGTAYLTTTGGLYVSVLNDDRWSSSAPSGFGVQIYAYYN